MESNHHAVQSNETVPSQKVFLNPTSGDALLSNLVNGSYNTEVLNPKNGKNDNDSDVVSESLNNAMSNTNNLTVATRDVRIKNG